MSGRYFQTLCGVIFLSSLVSLAVLTVALSAAAVYANQPFLDQQQRQQALEQQLTPVAPNITLSPASPIPTDNSFPTETPCFVISQVVLSGTSALPHWLPLQRLADQGTGHCLGAKGINSLMGRLQNRLIDHGYVTTRVLAPQQDLSSGTLRLVVMAGYVQNVKLTADSSRYATLYTAFPVHDGDLLNGLSDHGHDSGTTQSAISTGDITIRDTAHQQQDVAELSRDPSQANGSIQPIFNKEKEQQRISEAELISEIGAQAADIARTQGEINGLKAAKQELAARGEREPSKDAGRDAWQSWSEKLTSTTAYKDAQKEWGTGSDIQRGIQAATAVLQGLSSGGNLAGALAGASAPELANIIGHHAGIDDNDAAKAIAHAILGGAVAALQDKNIAAGASGAVTGELVAEAIAGQLYPDKKPADLSEQEKQQVSNLATIAAGMAGNIVGGDSSSVTVAAQAGKNVAENNALGATAGSDLGFWLGKTPDTTTEDKAKLAGEIAKGNTIVSAELAGTVGLLEVPAGAQVTAVIGGGANTMIQYLVNGEVNYTDALIASWVGAATSNTGLLGTVGWNATGGAASNYIKGDDPLTSAISSGVASGLGYGVGKMIQGPLDKVINPNWKNWEWVDVDMGISKPLPLNPLPGVAGNTAGSLSSEAINNQAGKKIGVLK